MLTLYAQVGQYCQQFYLKNVIVLLWDVFTLK